MSARLCARRAFAVVIVSLVGCHASSPPSLPTLARAPTAAYLTGKLAAYRGNDADAVDALRAAATAAPDEPMIAVALARAQAKADQRADALATLAAARARWADHPAIWLATGELLAGTGAGHDADGATHAFARAIELAPDDDRAYLGLAHVELARTRPAAAEAVLRKLIARIPTSVDGRYRLAQVLAARDDLAGAIVQLRAVLEADPDQLDARLDLARALRRTGHLADAIALTRSAFDRSDQSIDVAEELFWLLCEADDRAAATDLLGTLDGRDLPATSSDAEGRGGSIDDESRTADGLATIARLYRTLGSLADARRVAARLGTLSAPAGVLALAEADIADGDRAAGAARALAIEASSPTFAAARRVAGDALLANGDAAGALAAVAPARATIPKDLELALIAATARADQGAAADARALLAGLRSAPGVDANDLAVAQARLEDHLGATADALAILERTIAAAPDHVGALNFAGYLLADHALRLADADRYLRRARALAPGDPAILDSWGWLQLRRGDVAGAIRTLGQATRISPGEPELLVHLAAACAANHHPASARALLDRAAALHPTPEAQRRLAAVRASLPAASSISSPGGDTISP